MYYHVSDFLNDWKKESASTLRVLGNLTNASLSKKVYKQGRTLGFLAWHIAQTIPEMVTKVGISFPGFEEDAPAPKSAAEIVSAYKKNSALLVKKIAKWTDKELKKEDNMYGQMWKRHATLQTLISHEIHHRGQMTVLMRQAGLKVPGVCGPSKEDWAAYGMKAHP